MSGQPAANGGGLPRVWLLDGGEPHDVFEVVEASDGLLRARSPFLFEIGEEVQLRIEQGGATREISARVRGHVGAADKITELELEEPAR